MPYRMLREILTGADRVQCKAILCVDDEVIILLSLVQELKRAFGSQYVYEQAMNAKAALDLVEELTREHIQVIFIISDWLMPGMKGDEFLEIVKQRHPEIKAIMITGQADQQAIDRVKKIDSVVAVFNKPWSASVLIDIITKNSPACE
jgi:CheY-like chemotaxis protein